MAKTKTERILSIEDQITHLENLRKTLIQKQKEDDRKARTKRLIERGAIAESLIPDAEALTNEQVQTFLAKTIQTEYAKRILHNLKAQGGQADMPKPAETAPSNATVTPQTEATNVGQAG
ncbi:MAG: DUF3847 domain-containing protein [Oscillospiraceae bacterium]|nr:DUF3847 domain-containing protein [Oscillospiraceae bacterium]